jgi:drug/metabolite transporter (DMT)-like permease
MQPIDLDRRKYIFSICGLLIFAVLSATRDVYAKEFFSRRLDPLNPLFATFYLSFVTWIVFFVFNSLSHKRIYTFQDFRTSSTTTKRHIVYSNLLTLIGFWTALLAIKDTNAYVSALIDYGGSPAITVILAWIFLRERKSLTEIAGIILSLIGVIVLVQGLTADEPEAIIGLNPLRGAAFAIISAIAFGFNQLLNKELVLAGINRERIWLLRLPLLIVILGSFWIYTGFVGRPTILLTMWAILGTTIPLFLLVFAFERMQVTNVASFLFLIPVFCFIGSEMLGHFPTKASIGISIISGIIVLLGVVITERSGSDQEIMAEYMDKSG